MSHEQNGCLPGKIMENRYFDLNTYLRGVFGCRVQKISLDAGLTCPNRDGNASTGGCIYCNSEGSGTGASKRGLSITEQLERGKASLRRRYKANKFIAYFQSFSNTYASRERLMRSSRPCTMRHALWMTSWGCPSGQDPTAWTNRSWR